ncbi:hypothetical protein J40TS1_37450 [Paenibacillus montaniterrae]|uniref:CAAX prenyl protease 2/Lysostaphin resistance protein A-like domain-containing protein n=1 Tax=Paenibacillus montaniterrae TaxID=429341 RepID=A0A919YQC4_9BACL|nr:CPBP family intramembrane glutamic endopeptidase [Paenibacillus montaniterrae]GIP18103.1 hypothetical protein J40TS1_37450 [Paenibacillus montaniterrae]
MYLALCISVLLTFSYKLVDVLIKKRLKGMEKHTVLVWAVLIIVVTPFFKAGYVFEMPTSYEKAIPIFGAVALVNIAAARFSGYNPKGKYNITNFIVTYPIIEEIIFRGLLLPNLKLVFTSVEVIQLFYMPVTVPVIISALLFAICHLQYYKLSAQCIRFIVIAFFGGIILGAITELTQSILFALVLHIIFNGFSVIFATRYKKIKQE